jgi:hypothetical protein
MDLDEVEAHAFVPEAFICTYRRPHLFTSLGCLAIAVLALYFPVRHYFLFHTLGPATDSILQFDTMAYATPAFMAFGLMFLAWAVWFFLSSRNQSISLFHGVITWTGVTGRKRLQCAYAEVLTLSLRQSWHKNTYSCEVGTAKGPIRWDSSISSASSLLALAKRLARQNDLW